MEANHIHGLHALLQQLIDQGRMPIPESAQEYLGKSRAQLRELLARLDAAEAEQTAHNRQMDAILPCTCEPIPMSMSLRKSLRVVDTCPQHGSAKQRH